MHIVHYSLGLYPYRTGGMNKYVTDLIYEQAKEHQVSLLFPGKWYPYSSECKIVEKGLVHDVRCYQLINALPIPLFYGVKSPSHFMNRGINIENFEEFYNKETPEILHIHTFMGLPEDVLFFFKRKNVRVVYTSHDYFGLCLRVNLVNNKGELCAGPEIQGCRRCNRNANSVLFLRLRNSNVALFFRDCLKWIRNMKN